MNRFNTQTQWWEADAECKALNFTNSDMKDGTPLFGWNPVHLQQ